MQSATTWRRERDDAAARHPSLRHSRCGLRGADMPPACPCFAAHPLWVRIPISKIKRRPCGQRFVFWRRERDSNPRTGINRYTISNRAPSTNSAISASIFDCLATTLAIIAGFRLLSIRFLKKFPPSPLFHGRIKSPRMIERRRSIMRGAGEQIDVR